MNRRILNGVNRLLGLAGLQLVGTIGERAWDRQFRRWIDEAAAKGTDPNDAGDRDWSGNALERASRVLLPQTTESRVIVLRRLRGERS